MDNMTQQWNIAEGTEVYGADESKVGKVIAVYPRHIIVEKGFLFSKDYYVPFESIVSYDGERVYLNVTKDEALNRGWENEPIIDELQEPRKPPVANFDASGTATFASDQEILRRAGGSMGAAAGMGQSSTSPGLAGDLNHAPGVENPNSGG